MNEKKSNIVVVMRKSNRVILSLFAILLLLIGIGLLVKSSRWEGFAGNNTTVTFYYLPGCGWCEKAKPEWEKFKSQASSKGVDAKEVNANESPEEISRKGIKGFPTFIITKNGKDTEYSGERTAEALMKAALDA